MRPLPSRRESKSSLITSYADAEKNRSKISGIESILGEKIHQKKQQIIEEQILDLRAIHKRHLRVLISRIEAKRAELRRDREKQLQR